MRVLCVGMVSGVNISGVEADQQPVTEPWTFCSIPDFLNFDIDYPQQGWEDALGLVQLQ